jgi:hypothetical protein
MREVQMLIMKRLYDSRVTAVIKHCAGLGNRELPIDTFECLQAVIRHAEWSESAQSILGCGVLKQRTASARIKTQYGVVRDKLVNRMLE